MGYMALCGLQAPTSQGKKPGFNLGLQTEARAQLKPSLLVLGTKPGADHD